MSDRVLQPTAIGSSRARMAELRLQLAERENALTELSQELQELQSRYLAAVGGFYAELIELESAIVETEIQLGIRLPLEPDDFSETDADSDEEAAAAAAGCSNRAAPSRDLKAIFRNLAKTIHPDLALDEPARWRRHSLMAEANRAYAEQDEDRLRLILHAWERSPDSVLGDDPDADEERVRRSIASIEDRLLVIDREFGDLRTSAIFQLKRKIDDAKQKG